MSLCAPIGDSSAVIGIISYGSLFSLSATSFISLQSVSLTHFKELPAEKIAVAEVNISGITWVKTKGLIQSSP